VGTVSPGKYADVIAGRGDVLRSVGLLQSVNIIVHRGARCKWRRHPSARPGPRCRMPAL